MPKFYKALKTVLKNTVLINALGIYPLFRFQKWLGVSFNPDDIPGGLTILRDFAVCALCVEIAFYHSHR